MESHYKEEVERIEKDWDADLMALEEGDVTTLKVYFNYSELRSLDAQFIYHKDAEGAILYPSSKVDLRLKSKVLPKSLVDTLIKKSEAMIDKLNKEGKQQVFEVF